MTMSTVSPKVKPYIEAASEEGLEFVECVQNKHFKLKLRAPDGRVKAFSMSVSASDHRALRNARTLFRRFAQGA